MWGSKVIKFRACFNYIWKQLLSIWLPWFFLSLSPFHSQVSSIVFSLYFFILCSKKHRIARWICFYCTLELTGFRMHPLNGAREWLTSELRAQFTNWCESFQLFSKTMENYVSNELLIKLQHPNANTGNHTMWIWIRKSKCLHLEKGFSAKVDYVILIYEHPIALNVQKFPSFRCVLRESQSEEKLRAGNKLKKRC